MVGDAFSYLMSMIGYEKYNLLLTVVGVNVTSALNTPPQILSTLAAVPVAGLPTFEAIGMIR